MKFNADGKFIIMQITDMQEVPKRAQFGCWTPFFTPWLRRQ